MVRKGSPVRVRQRASTEGPLRGPFVILGRFCSCRCTGRRTLFGHTPFAGGADRGLCRHSFVDARTVKDTAPAMTEEQHDDLSEAAQAESYDRFFGGDAWTDEERRRWIEDRRAHAEERRAADDRRGWPIDPYEEADRQTWGWVAAMRRDARERNPSLSGYRSRRGCAAHSSYSCGRTRSTPIRRLLPLAERPAVQRRPA